jgi:2-dehydro-3-deoxygalactonokinase
MGCVDHSKASGVGAVSGILRAMLPECESPAATVPADPGPVLVALDWGTSSLRAWLLDRSGRILDRRESALGILSVADGRFRHTMDGFCGSWFDGHPSLPVIACGMIGSRQGWREAPYLQTPARPDALAAGLTGLDDLAGRIFRIVPGLSTRLPAGSPDVIRGEETQVFGAMSATGPGQPGRNLFVLPGTHSKWVDVRHGAVQGFRTYMTGELYALLRQQSILARLCEEPSDADAPAVMAAFDDGVDRAHADPAALAHLLFTVRSEGLFGERAPACLPAYLSGLLIGAELASGLGRTGQQQPPCLIGAPALCDRYLRAFRRVGVQATVATGEPACDGLFAIAVSARLIDSPSPGGGD